MSREIKFRVWDNINKEWVVGLGLTLGSMSRDAGDIFTLMQYTGLKDKNGKEIYEGDIVHIIDPDFPKPVQLIVQWNERGLNWTVWKPGLPKEVQVIGNIYEEVTNDK